VAFGLSSADSAGNTVSTAWSSFDVGARERIPIGRSVVLGLLGGYGEMAYSFGNTLDTPAELPGVRYRFLWSGLAGRIILSELSLYACGVGDSAVLTLTAARAARRGLVRLQRLSRTRWRG
jgi:hypothetical protein